MNTTQIAREAESFENIRSASLDRHKGQTVVEVMSRDYNLDDNDTFLDFLEDYGIDIIDSENAFGERSYIIGENRRL